MVYFDHKFFLSGVEENKPLFYLGHKKNRILVQTGLMSKSSCVEPLRAITSIIDLITKNRIKIS